MAEGVGMRTEPLCVHAWIKIQEGLAVASIARDDHFTLPGLLWRAGEEAEFAWDTTVSGCSERRVKETSISVQTPAARRRRRRRLRRRTLLYLDVIYRRLYTSICRPRQLAGNFISGAETALPCIRHTATQAPYHSNRREGTRYVRTFSWDL